MGKAPKKTGKGRLDKYYKLAKEQGYRARSAFKLIQLNKKYSFLESARCCIDLCAAPGGWLQVASKYMPINSIIVGVDLVPIKPIPRVSTFAADITSAKCRNLIRNELKDWKADVVLHDGAPNVGSAWVQDAYSQAELVLMSLKLAAEFLIKGGTFVTKVFRSADYNNLLWVFNQLFRKVEATKPPSSRNVSAEIFVVCRDFLSPKHVDPKFFEPKHVFKDTTALPNTGIDAAVSTIAQANIFQPEKKRRHRDGYEEGDYTLFKSIPAEEFIRGNDPIGNLGKFNQISFRSEEEKRWSTLNMVTKDIEANCQDLKVLGKRDFKALIKWRESMRDMLGIEVKKNKAEAEAEAEAEPSKESVKLDPTNVTELEDTMLEEELGRLHASQLARRKRERRRANEKRTKTIQRMQLQMTAPMDIGMEQSDAALMEGQEDVFDLAADGGSGRLSTLQDACDLSSDETSPISEQSWANDDNEAGTQEALEDELDALYSDFRQRRAERDAKFKASEMRKMNKLREQTWKGIGKSPESDGSVDGEEESDGSELGGWDLMMSMKADANEDDSPHSDLESDNEIADVQPLKRRRTGDVSNSPPLPDESKRNHASEQWFSQSIFAGVDDTIPIYDETRVDDVQMRIDEFENGTSTSLGDPADQTRGNDTGSVGDDARDSTVYSTVEGFGLVTAEAITLAQELVNKRTTRTNLINDGFNRHNFRDKDDLPAWFLDDEAKHYKSNVPVTKEAVAALRAKQRALDARPIKKIAEAKARKKMKAVQRYTKAMRKAEGINQNSDISEREKAAQIQKLMTAGASKGGPKAKTKREVKVVVAKGAHKGIKGRPKGVKGRYAMVDARMRKEMRAKKKKDKESGAAKRK